MDWLGIGGFTTGALGLVAAAWSAWYARRANEIACDANREAERANEIAEEALEAQRGPEFAFSVAHAPSPDHVSIFRLTNTGWQTVTGVEFDPTEPGGSIFGSFAPELVNDIDWMEPGESVRFEVGVLAPNRWGTDFTWVFPTHVFVRVRESDRIFRVDMPAKIS